MFRPRVAADLLHLLARAIARCIFFSFLRGVYLCGMMIFYAGPGIACGSCLEVVFARRMDGDACCRARVVARFFRGEVESTLR